MSDLAIVEVPPDAWLPELRRHRDDGLAYLDLLTAVDRIDDIEVLAHLLDPATGRRALVSTRVPADDPRLVSAAADFPAAAWHERETAEMFGLDFAGHPDPRPLLRHDPGGRPPLRKATPLDERLARPWPAQADERPGRRRQPPPGVRAEWVVSPPEGRSEGIAP